MNTKDYPAEQCLPSPWLGSWESVNGNPDVYIFQRYDGNYYLLAYYYDRDYGRGSFSCYEIEPDETGWHVCMNMKNNRLSATDAPYTLHIGSWGDYMKN
jgi:hypothetical protein